MDASDNFYLPAETNISSSADHSSSSSLLQKRNCESFTDADFDEEEEEEKKGASSSSLSSPSGGNI